MNKPFHSKNSSAAKLAVTNLFLLLLGLTACQQEGGPAPAPPPPEVKIMTIVAKTIPDEVEFIGQTASFRPVEIRSQVTGIIKKVLFTEGRDVRKGEKLYLIDPVPFKASVASAKGRVGQALARLAQARAELARVMPLLAEQAVSQKDVDDAIAEKLGTEAALVTAKGDWEKAKFDLRNTFLSRRWRDDQNEANCMRGGWYRLKATFSRASIKWTRSTST